MPNPRSSPDPFKPFRLYCCIAVIAALLALGVLGKLLPPAEPPPLRYTNPFERLWLQTDRSGYINHFVLQALLTADPPQPTRERFDRSLLLFNIAADSAEIPLGDSTLRLASVQEARDVLGRVDAFTKEWSRFDLQIRLRKTDAALESAARQFAADQAIPWEEREAERLRRAAARLAEKLAPFRFDLPRPTLVIHTTGREESEAAYCRQNAVILPRTTDGWNEDRLTRILLHELFHVWSRANPEARAKLYAAIGFEACPPVELPAAWKDRKITNPDGPGLDQLIRLKGQAGEQLAVPLLYADPPSYDPKHSDSLFKYLKFKLLVVRREEDRTLPVINDGGEPLLLDPQATPSYAEQIGRNTGYIIHPDEILAENFVQVVLDAKEPATPRVHEAVRKAFLRQ